MITDNIITIITTDIKIDAEIITDNTRKKLNNFAKIPKFIFGIFCAECEGRLQLTEIFWLTKANPAFECKSLQK